MLIYHPYKKQIPEQIFLYTDSYYLVLNGKMSLINLKTKERVILDQKNSFLGKVERNIPYQMEILSESILFMEIRERNVQEKI